MKLSRLSLLMLIGILVQPVMNGALAEEPALDLSEILAGDWRSEEERARDEFRNPQETLAFFGLEPGATVVEIWPGRGWYTKILAPYVNQTGGTYYSANFDPNSDRSFVAAALKNFKETFIDQPEIYGAVNNTVFPALEGETIAPAGSADLVVTFRNVHNMVPGGYAEKALTDMYVALKPGGVLGVVDHRLPKSIAQDDEVSSGYLHEDDTIKLIESVGFVFEAASDVNNNPKDTADHPFGVWTLPPTLRSAPRGEDPNPDFDQSSYIAIGESDRFTLRFRKPAQ